MHRALHTGGKTTVPTVVHAPDTLGRMEGFLVLFMYALGVYILYWTIRYAVRHAIRDADERREKAAKRRPRP